ncbi:rhodanese-related sulfurtransferase [Arcticibacter tournemirensis]|uniref:Rhodanese-like domain-containing protein n=1 Tax=Arcticibacter tournemirensis TaxID=699437 RepID=A0A5M9GST5_9SPHI|nr:rhodanese-like domain-containing protein [Arcticibacter tournemirensis]KAA8476781.1 rhodanese-like domain-containing protein [Arcticibacter tournemirensis]TQM50801.1 rhodanese-related sulfurtransferase [Arcticibacter tournemirensis]
MTDLFKFLLFWRNPVNFKELVDNGALIIDVRTPGEYKSGHIQGSVNIPLNKLNDSIAMLRKRSKPVITCCASGMRSASAVYVLKAGGIEEVYNGGAWKKLSRRTG